MSQIKILFVEDESFIRSELGEFLNRYADRGLCIASNGQDGLEPYHTCAPDIVI